MASEKRIMQELKTLRSNMRLIKADLTVIKRNIVDPDTILTVEAIRALDKAEEDFKAGRTKRLV